MHPAPASASNERTKAVVLDLAKQWKLLEEKRLEHRRAVEDDAVRLEDQWAAVAAERAAVAELKVCGRRACPAWVVRLRCHVSYVAGRVGVVRHVPCAGTCNAPAACRSTDGNVVPLTPSRREVELGNPNDALTSLRAYNRNEAVADHFAWSLSVC